MSTIPEIVPFSETISQTAQEGLGVGAQVIAKSEMPEIVHSGESSQPGQEGLRVGQDVRKSTMPEVGQSDVETSQPVVSGSTSEMSLRAAIDCDLKSEQMGGVHLKGQSSDAATQNPIGLDEKQFAATKLQSVSEKKSAEVKLFEASKDSEWFDAIEKKNCKFLLDLFRSDRSRWVQTGLKGRSVLHVAVMQGCSELVHELHYYEGDLVPCGKNWQTPFEFLWENARDGRLKNASAHDLWLVMEGPVDIAVGRDLFAMSWNDYRMPWNSEDREKLKSRGQWLFGRSRDDYIRSHVMYRMPGGSEDHEMLSLREAISSIANKEKFVMDETDVDFNFENVERKELYLHMACSRLRNVRNQQDFQSSGCEHIRNFIIAVLNHLPQNLLQKLFDQKDAQGRTILQVLITPGAEADDNFVFGTFEEMLKILPDVCVNTLDKAGRTILHWAVAHEIIWAVYRLLKSSKVRRDITFQTAYIENVSALDLILIYDLHLPTDFGLPYWPSLKDELAKQCGVYALYNEEYLASDCKRLNIAHTPLENAIVMGRNKFVKDIMKTLEQEDEELDMLKNNKLLALAAISGNFEILQLFLQKHDVDKLNVICEYGAPPLHLAVKAQPITCKPNPRNFDDWLHCNDFISIKLLEKKLLEQDLVEDSVIPNTNKTEYDMPNTNSNQYSARKVCANLLLQSGADILATDKDGYMADPGEWAPNEARIWWYKSVAKETLNIKKDLHAAATGTAVVATLVATASFVGPLTPPLNYVTMSSGTTTVDVGVQVTELPIKVFLVSNSLSFYLAITSIMLAIMPSLPIPKEGLVFGPCDDLKRSRRTISIAIGMLLASIISVLISFAASSFVVIPLQHRKLMAYSTSIGGLICCIGIFFFFLRFLRVIWRQSTFIRKLYQWIGKL